MDDQSANLKTRSQYANANANMKTRSGAGGSPPAQRDNTASRSRARTHTSDDDSAPAVPKQAPAVVDTAVAASAPPVADRNNTAAHSQERTQTSDTSAPAVVEKAPAIQEESPAVVEQAGSAAVAAMPELVLLPRPPLLEDEGDRRIVLEREKMKRKNPHPNQTRVHFACPHCEYGAVDKKTNADPTVPLEIYGPGAILGSSHIYTYDADGEVVDFDFSIGSERDTGMKLFHKLEMEFPAGLPKESYSRISKVSFYLRKHYKFWHYDEELPVAIEKKTEEHGLAPSKAKSIIAKRKIGAEYQAASRARKQAAKESGAETV